MYEFGKFAYQTLLDNNIHLQDTEEPGAKRRRVDYK